MHKIIKKIDVKSDNGFLQIKLIGYLFFIVLLFDPYLLISQTNSPRTDTTTKWDYILPFGSDWAIEKGIDLPLPFGISAFYTLMARNVDVTDVTVELGERPPESINEFSSFEVRNKTSVYATRLDVWVLPIMNVYALAGYATTDANLKAKITIDRKIQSLPDIVLDINNNMKVNGPYLGIGSTLVAGYKSWFIMGDANYGITLPDEVDNSIDFTFLSARTGLAGKISDSQSFKAWLGAAYLYSRTTLRIKETSDEIGDIVVQVEQHPVNPLTIQCGWILGFSKHFDLMVEFGTNFDDASVAVACASFRF